MISSYFSNEEICNLDMEPMQNGVVDERCVYRISSNGLGFTGFIDRTTGETAYFFLIE
ncbi:hypothetical protein [Oceanobacillus timonensis]|uniref:hypothetical protein n=1 Tax=Oceanobacillus timonensis TaxID=1926285 RepID=UPI0015C46896|nr:hypothetical protein [Oceanobacillus timonensis]